MSWSQEEVELATEFINNFNVRTDAIYYEDVVDEDIENTSIKTIDWDYWAGLQNITPHQAAKLVQLIDPIIWPNDIYALGPLPDDLKEKITRMTQQLESCSQLWSLSSLVETLGDGNVPLRMVQATLTGPKPEAVDTASNDIANSGLLNEPSRKDDWFQLIDDMTRAFYVDFKELPNEVQAWGRLWASPPAGYEITTDTDKGEYCLKMPGVSPLSRTAFNKRWAKYSDNSGQ